MADNVTGAGETQSKLTRFDARFDIFISTEMKEEAMALARKREVSLAQVLRDALRHELERNREVEPALREG
jgi:hypothetical protein